VVYNNFDLNDEEKMIAQDKKQNIIEIFKEALIKTLFIFAVFIILYEGLSTIFIGLDDPLMLKFLKTLDYKHWIGIIVGSFTANVIIAFYRNVSENTKNTLRDICD